MALNSTYSAASVNGWKSNDYINNPWSINQILLPSNNVYQDFGSSFATTSDFSLIVVGAPTYPGPPTLRGIVYIYSGSPATGYTEIQTIQSSDIANFDAFGLSIDVSEDKNYIVVGATSKITGVGGTYIFVKSGSTYVQQASLPTIGGKIETTVSIDGTGTYLIVGSPTYDSGGFTNMGRVDIYLRTGSSWSNVKSYIGVSTDSEYGVSVYINTAGDFIWFGTKNGANAMVFGATRTGATWNAPAYNPILASPGRAFVSASGDNQYIAVVSGNAEDTVYIRKYVPTQYDPQTSVPSGVINTEVGLSAITDALPSISNDRYMMSGSYLYQGLNASWSLINTFYGPYKSVYNHYQLNGPSSIDSTGTYFAGTTYDATVNGVASNGAVYIYKKA